MTCWNNSTWQAQCGSSLETSTGIWNVAFILKTENENIIHKLYLVIILSANNNYRNICRHQAQKIFKRHFKETLRIKILPIM